MSARTNASPISADRLKSFVDRYERLNEERAAIGGDMRDILTEAKGVGYDPATIRWLVKERNIDAAKRDERDQLRDIYAHALGIAVSLVEVEGLSLRKAAQKAGVSKSSLHRALAVPDVSQPAGPGHDPETGEISETVGWRPPGEGSRHDQRPDGPGSALATPSPADDGLEIPPFLDRRQRAAA